MQIFSRISIISPFYWTYVMLSSKQIKLKEDANMNRNRRKPPVPRYPNAADRRYYMEKILNGLLAIVTGIGAFVTLVFFMLL